MKQRAESATVQEASRPSREPGCSGHAASAPARRDCVPGKRLGQGAGAALTVSVTAERSGCGSLLRHAVMTPPFTPACPWDGAGAALPSLWRAGRANLAQRGGATPASPLGGPAPLPGRGRGQQDPLPPLAWRLQSTAWRSHSFYRMVTSSCPPSGDRFPTRSGWGSKAFRTAWVRGFRDKEQKARAQSLWFPLTQAFGGSCRARTSRFSGDPGTLPGRGAQRPEGGVPEPGSRPPAHTARCPLAAHARSPRIPQAAPAGTSRHTVGLGTPQQRLGQRGGRGGEETTKAAAHRELPGGGLGSFISAGVTSRTKCPRG